MQVAIASGDRKLSSAVEQYPKLRPYFESYVLPTWPLSLDADLQPIPGFVSVRNVKYDRYSNKYVYINVIGNRYCHNIQRQHTSNNIFFRVNLSAFIFRQGCYDVACNKVLSAAIPFPPEVLN